MARASRSDAKSVVSIGLVRNTMSVMDVVEPIGEVMAQGRTFKRFGHVELDRRQEGQRDLRKPLEPELASHPREHRILGAVDAHRQHPGTGHVGDGAGSLVDLHEGTGDGEASFRKDHDLAAALQLVDEGPQGERVGRIDGEKVEELEPRLDPPAVGDAGVDGKARPLRRKADNSGPSRSDVWLRRSPPCGRRRRCSRCPRPRPVEETEQPARQIVDELLRQQPADDDRGRGIGDGEAHEQAAWVMNLNRTTEATVARIMKTAFTTLFAAMTRERLGGEAGSA